MAVRKRSQPSGSVATAARRAFAAQHRRIAALEGAVRRGRDPEALHQMRVATRRARAALRVFGGYLPPPVREDARRDLRRLGRALGPARDADILLGHVEARLAGLPRGTRAELLPLRGTLVRRGEQAHAELVRFLAGPPYRRARQALEQLADARPWGPSAAAPLGPAASRLVAARLAEASIALRDSAHAGGDVEALHALRIRLKEARYAVEFTQGALPGGAKGLLAELRRLQDELGAIQDGVVEEAEVRGAADELPLDAAGRAALEVYLASCTADRRRRLARVAKVRRRSAAAIARGGRLARRAK